MTAQPPVAGSEARGTGAAWLIGGKLFHPMNLVARTFRADAAQTKLISELGLDRTDIAPGEAEPMLDYVSRLQARIVDTGRIAELLGHYLLPSGKTETDWTLDMARETADWINNVQDDESRRLIWELAAEFVFFFLRSNLARLAISANFLDTPADPERVANPDDVASSNPTLANGHQSLGRWQKMISLWRGPWRPGRSVKG